ncbi:DUF805 domain-containing protein [Pseudooceanicola sp.]|uniref:DUF805 domain-containing protein n=1 Tax=Pseudooceanicola sp. TaxID=1914328 RepID=UPI0026033C6A|nr:DUF805 domain-containing protein [Pseudooceanicola sp.]MDF1856897.1 DUF805 domain-containing protein [Pseudooceanicola sp.]
MGFTQAVRICFRKYVTFSGRASRREYWLFVLFVVLGSIVAGILDGMAFGASSFEVTDSGFSAQSNGPIASIFSLLVFLPVLAAGWRRMHDSGRSGLFLLYPIIVTIGTFGFISMIGGTEALAGGDLTALFSGALGLILVFAFFILAISPLLVIWWLTRPSQPGPNQWGPPVQTQSPERP